MALRLSEGLGVTACDDEEVSSTAYQPHDPLEGVGPDGVIVTGARRSAVQPEFLPVLTQAIERLNSADHGVSVYVYGSVATGMARIGSSDVDLVTIGADAAQARQLASDLSAAHRGLCRGVEIGPARFSDYEGGSDEAYGNCVFLKHYCVHLSGPDPARTLPSYQANRAAARGFNGDIGFRAAQWRTVLKDVPPPSLARRVARKTLFAVSGLVSVYDARWTTDRVESAQRWSAIRSDMADELGTLVSWAFSSHVRVTTSEIQDVLDGAVVELVAEFNRRIGLWGVPCDA